MKYPKIRSSSGNVFADLKVSDPEIALVKAEIAAKIFQIIKRRKLSQPKVSLLLRGYLTNFSLERLFRFLNDLGQDVYISIRPSSHSGHGHTRIGESPSRSRIAALSK